MAGLKKVRRIRNGSGGIVGVREAGSKTLAKINASLANDRELVTGCEHTSPCEPVIASRHANVLVHRIAA